MSHKATGWLADVSGVSPSEFRILFILCDCHNPSKGCFPSQEYIKAKSGMSNGSINNQLNSLEAKGIITRIRRVNPETKQRMSTAYILEFEQPKPSPNFGEGAISKKQPKPSPKNSQSHLQILETNYVKEPVKEPVIVKQPKKATQIPREWLDNPPTILSDKNLTHAITQGMTPQEASDETYKFRDWAEANGKTYKNWDAAWRTRCNNFGKFNGNRPAQRGGDQLRIIANAARGDEIPGLDWGQG